MYVNHLNACLVFLAPGAGTPNCETVAKCRAKAACGIYCFHSWADFLLKAPPKAKR